MNVTLNVLAPAKWAGKMIPIARERFVIGRDADCHLRSHSSHVAGRHCALLIRGERVFLRDFESASGTSITGRQIRGEIELVHDDQVTVGPLTFGVGIESAARSCSAAKPAIAHSPHENIDDDVVAAMMLFMEKGDANVAGLEVGADTVDTPLAATYSDKPATADRPARQPPLGKPRATSSSPTRDLMQELLGPRRKHPL
ncbi:MAG: FHA domain-containing protein [Planctomycetes bacterium]|nr:FHA domain-containing protein [Planctomycetota bacterium]